MKVFRAQEYQGTQWVFVEDHEAGIPMSQIEVVEKVSEKPKVDPPLLPLTPPEGETKPGTRVSRFALKEGDVVIHFPDGLSADSVEDLDGFWQVFIKKARREAAN